MTDSVKLLPQPALAPRHHVWQLAHAEMAGADFPDGYRRTLRQCSVCGVIKGTVHGNGWVKREWRTKDGKIWDGASAPACLEISEGD